MTTAAPKAPSDQGSFDIPLEGAKYGEVVTRFPPEPTGYLHIGHAKAALLNQYFARTFGGKLIIRFDDTNPIKEKIEFEDSIIEDLKLLGVTGDVVTHTSDYFDQLFDYAVQLIEQGDAYCDNTPMEEMRNNRFHGTPSPSRDASVEENKQIFLEMQKGSEAGLGYCLRAKIDMQEKNKALRDPVIYRCHASVPHYRTGTKYKVYPTYDFACPIVDSIEGVTHTLRTNEYADRNSQFYWFIRALKLRKPLIWDFSRMSFVYTLLSKRKLTWFVSQGLVSGWDDPRFPTVRGILRRGLTLNALRSYILMQGASKNTLLLEWDKLWAMNRKEIDPIAPRYTALASKDIVPLLLKDGPTEVELRSSLRHKKNESLGNKDVPYGSHIYLSQEDAASLDPNEEITLMNWGNVIVQDIKKDSLGKVTAVEAILHLEGDFKKTKKKLTWLTQVTDLVKVNLVDYDFLITKKKLEEEDSVENCLSPQTEFITEAFGEPSLREVKKGDIIQLERIGYFVCDQLPTPDEPSLKLILIPDGKAKSIASKSAPVPAPSAKKSTKLSAQAVTNSLEDLKV